MPKAKPRVKKTKKSSVVESLLPAETKDTGNQKVLPKNKKVYIIILLLGLILLAYYKKSWFIAATVNGSPVSNFELLNRMNKQFRDQTLTQLINEKIILAEASRKNITVSPTELNQKISDIEKNVGGAETLNTLLQQQGQTRESLKQQLEFQLLIEKLYSPEATVSASEVDEFISKNPEQLRASDSAAQVTEATEILKQQKLSQIFNERFQQLKQAANIKIFQ